MVFRDETQRITTKIKKKAQAKRASTADLSTKKGNSGIRRLDRQVTKRVQSPKQPSIAPSIHQSLQEIAVHFFLGDYIRNSHFVYLPSLYNTNQTNDVLTSVIKAVGLASLALQTSRPELQDDAQKFYVDAIASTNLALQSKDVARNDDVLASTLLLSLFETLSPRTHVSVDAWTAHVHGAGALIALRGPEQFKTHLGLQLFKQVAANIRVLCVQHGIRVPRQLRELTQLAKDYSNGSNVSLGYPSLSEAFTDLRADMTEGLLTEPEDIIARAQDILQRTDDLHASLPPDYRYETVLIQNPCAEIHAGYYHKFKDHYVAQIWNTTKMGKMHLNTMILEQLSKVPATSTELSGKRIDMMIECEREAIEAVDNICASVPQFFPPDCGHILPRNTRSAASGYFLIWPLFNAGCSSLIQPSTRKYIVNRLEYIAKDLKLPQAGKAAQMLAQEDLDESWMHIYHVF